MGKIKKERSAKKHRSTPLAVLSSMEEEINTSLAAKSTNIRETLTGVSQSRYDIQM